MSKKSHGTLLAGRELMEKALENMLGEEIISCVVSESSAKVVLMIKKYGSQRFSCAQCTNTITVVSFP